MSIIPDKLIEEKNICLTTFFWDVERALMNLFYSNVSATKLLTVLIPEKAYIIMVSTCYAIPDASSYETLLIWAFICIDFIISTPATSMSGRNAVSTALNCQHLKKA